MTTHPVGDDRNRRSPSPRSTSPRLRWRDHLEDTYVIPARGDWRYAVTDMPFPNVHSDASALEENTVTTLGGDCDDLEHDPSLTFSQDNINLDAWANLSAKSDAMERYSYDHNQMALENRLSSFLQSCSAGSI